LQLGNTVLDTFVSASPQFAESLPAKLDLSHLAESSPGHLYVLIDAARGPQVRNLLRTPGAHIESLYEGDSKSRLEDVAPYLMNVTKASPLLDTLTSSDWWGKNLSLYLHSSEPFAGVRSHLRRFLLVKNEAGEQLYFRFYDPRALPLYLQTLHHNRPCPRSSRSATIPLVREVRA
jgi:hypothetical protein